MKPLAIDLFCGLGGWAEGLLAEGYDVVGFDIERHRYPGRALPDSESRKVRASGVDFNNPRVGGSENRSFNYANEVALRNAPLTGGWIEYPAQLVLQDVLTLHGSQFKDAALIVASPPCQFFSYTAMPWSRARVLAAEVRADPVRLDKELQLFRACFRIQREACDAVGRHIPMVVESVRGAIPWVGRSRWNFGSYHLWGDVPALMPITLKSPKVGGFSWSDYGKEDYLPKAFNGEAVKDIGFRFDGGGRSFQSESVAHPVRKFASAMIAKIPLPLSRHIGAVFKPREMAA